MKSFFQFIAEATASQQAQRLGLVGMVMAVGMISKENL